MLKWLKNYFKKDNYYFQLGRLTITWMRVKTKFHELQTILFTQVKVQKIFDGELRQLKHHCQGLQNRQFFLPCHVPGL
jgi:hypothetical protein